MKNNIILSLCLCLIISCDNSLKKINEDAYIKALNHMPENLDKYLKNQIIAQNGLMDLFTLKLKVTQYQNLISLT